MGPSYPAGGWGGRWRRTGRCRWAHGSGAAEFFGKGIEAKEWGQGSFLSSFLCLHSFAKSVLGIGVQIPVGHGAFAGPLSPPTCAEPERRNSAAWVHGSRKMEERTLAGGWNPRETRGESASSRRRLQACGGLFPPALKAAFPAPRRYFAPRIFSTLSSTISTSLTFPSRDNRSNSSFNCTTSVRSLPSACHCFAMACARCSFS